MDEAQKKALRKDFEEWSGGFPPESGDQIVAYLDNACAVQVDWDGAYIWLRNQTGEGAN